MGMCYLPDGTTEMIFDVYGAWKVVEEKCGSDIVSEIKNSIEEETANREIDTFEIVGDVRVDIFEIVGDVRVDIFNMMKELEPLAKKDGVTGKLFKKITTQLEKIDSDLNDAQNRLDI